MLSLFTDLTNWFKAKLPEGSKQAAGPSEKKCAWLYWLKKQDIMKNIWLQNHCVYQLNIHRHMYAHLNSLKHQQNYNFQCRCSHINFGPETFKLRGNVSSSPLSNWYIQQAQLLWSPCYGGYRGRKGKSSRASLLSVHSLFYSLLKAVPKGNVREVACFPQERKTGFSMGNQKRLMHKHEREQRH